MRSPKAWAASPLVQSFVAGTLAALALPPFGVWPGIFGFGLLLRQLDRSSTPRPLRSAFLRGWVAGLAFFLVSTWWVGEAFLVDFVVHGWQAPFAIFLLAGGLALLWGAAATAYRGVSPGHCGRLLVFAAIFSIFEWLRGHILTGFPWDLPGETWRAGSAPSQGASVVGAYGMTFLTLAIGGAPGLWRRAARRAELISLASAATALAALWLAGSWRLAAAQAPAALPGVRLRVVQPDIGQSEKWSPEALLSIISRYTQLTAEPAAQRPDIVLWPEGAIPDTLEDLLAPSSTSRMMVLGSLFPGQILILGTIRVEGSAEKPVYFNSLVVLRRTADDLAVIGRYDKHHLVPFGEYMPFDSFSSAIGFKTLVHIGDGFTSGPPSVALSVPGMRPFQPLICYESLFPNSFARSGPRPQWIANISNDAWFGETSGPWQHLNLASYRAIEEGIPVVRATPTGVSAVVDAYGRPLELLKLGQAGVIDQPLPTSLEPTLYSRWGEAPFWILCVLGASTSLIRRGGGPGRESDAVRRQRPRGGLETEACPQGMASQRPRRPSRSARRRSLS